MAQLRDGDTTQWHKPIPIELGVANMDERRVQMHILSRKPRQFRKPEPGGVEHLQNGAIPNTRGGGQVWSKQDRANLFATQNQTRQRVGYQWERDTSNHVGRYHSTFGEELQEASRFQ